MRQLVLICPIGEHRPDLCAAALLPFKNNVACIRSPRGKIVRSRLVRQLLPALGRNVHDVDVLAAWRARSVLPIPAERQELAAR